MTKSLIKTALLGVLAFILGTSLEGRILPVDFLYLFTVIVLLRWGMVGAMVAGLWAGLLASLASGGTWIESVFLYVLLAYFASLIVDRTARRTVFSNTWTAALLTLFYGITTHALQRNIGFADLELWPVVCQTLVLTAVLSVDSLKGKNESFDSLAKRVAR